MVCATQTRSKDAEEKEVWEVEKILGIKEANVLRQVLRSPALIRMVAGNNVPDQVEGLPDVGQLLGAN